MQKINLHLDTSKVIDPNTLEFNDSLLAPVPTEQGTGSYASHVVLKKTSLGEFLTIIQNTSLSAIDENDFSAI